MTRSTLISIEDDLSQFIDQQVDRGRYGSPSEVVEAGLRLLEERESKLGSIQAALIQGEASGDFQDFDADRFLAGMRQPAGL